MPEALVTIRFGLMTGPESPRVLADALGRFVFVNVPPGRYGLLAEKMGYSSGWYGQRLPGLGSSAHLDLADGQIQADVLVPVWKHGAISGTVTDEAGQPVVGVRVDGFRKVVTSGEVRLAPHDPNNETAITDDRGMYRLSNLWPGEYAVAVATTLTTFPAATMAETQVTGAVRTQAFLALRDMPAPLGDARSQQIGESVLLATTQTAIPPSVGGEIPAVYRTTFSPGTPLPAEATVVALRSGDERTLNVALRPSRAARVAGRLVGPDGPVSHAVVILLATGPWRFATSPAYGATARALTDAAGRFTFLGVPEGEYIFMTRTGDPQVGYVGAIEPVTVSGADVVDLTVTAQRAPRVTGRFDLRTGNPPESHVQAFGPLVLFVSGTPVDLGPYSFSLVPRGPELRFEALVPPGRYTLTMASPEGAWCMSVLLRGRDIADEVFVVGSEDLDLTVICGDATTRVRGTVRKDDGVVDADAAIVAFPVERTSWVGPAWRPRRFQSATTDAAGGFTLVNLPAGEYFVAAIPISRSQLWQDPALLDTLTRAATRVSLTMSESRTVELRTVQIK